MIEVISKFFKKESKTVIPIVFTETPSTTSDYASGNVRSISLDEFETLWNNKSLCNSSFYLKDWHFTNDLINVEAFYSIPAYFQKDLLSSLCKLNNEEEYKFLYFGDKGTKTNFHHDICFSYSWSSNIFGSKKWKLFNPSQRPIKKLMNFSFSTQDFLKTEELIIVQNPGETVSVQYFSYFIDLYS